MRMKFGAMGLGVLMLSMAAAPAMCQQKEVHVYRNPWSGDTPENPGPLAKKLSPKLKAKDIAKAMRKVGDWELTQATPHFMPDWTEAVLYRGYMAAAKSLPDAEYRKAMLDMANKTDWKMGVRETVADDQAVAYTYLDFYRQEHDAKMLAPTKATLDKVMPLPDLCVETCPKWGGKDMPMWWWADSLYMAAPVWAEMYAVTGDKAYLDHMDKLWWTTSKLLYDTDEHLYSRDASFLNKHEANGKKVFWSRGNGWVMGALAEVLREMPADYPSRPLYVAQFREMAAKLASIQGADGLWRPGLMNAAAYPLPEVSGSAFYIYAMAWGINHGVLDRATYLPVVKKGWAGMVSHVYADGRLGSIQPVGSSPDAFKPQSSYVYGVGAFLLAGSELRQMEMKKK